MHSTAIMREPDGAVPNSLAIVYAFGGYACGISLLIHPAWTLNALGFLLLSSALSVAAYLIHDCAHSTLFAKSAHNTMLGECLGWVTGSCYGAFAGIRRKHLRHHADRVDNVSFDYQAFLRQRPLLYRGVRWLEWCYVPAIDFIMHGFVIVAPFVSDRFRQNRSRVVTCLLTRGAAFTALFVYSPKALLLYVVAYVLFLHFLRFIDMTQHLYELVVLLGDEPVPGRAQRPDKAYEDANTYSNPFPERLRWLNLLTLNFVFHNAHHANPSVPWYRLPQLHRKRYDDESPQVLPLWNTLVNYHRGRIGRILYEFSERERNNFAEPAHIPGAHGLSFLTQL
ncbi:MAG: fatty acid desaturase family protein [Gammaproteobacteria bacterium]